MRHRHLATLLVLSLLAGVAGVVGADGVAGAAEPPKDADAATVKQAMERFKREFDTEDIDFKMEAIKRVAKVQHPTVAAELVKLLRDKDPTVREYAARGLGKQLTSPGKAGPALVKYMNDTAEDPRVVSAALSSIGSLEWRKATQDVINLIDHAEDRVVATAFEVLGIWKEQTALQPMLDFFERYPDEKSFSTGSVTVDTGAAGGEDAAKAQAKWKAKYGGQRNWRPRPECTKALRAALKEITGHGFRRPADLRTYLNAPEKYNDPETITTRMPEADRKDVWKSWKAVEVEAQKRSEKDVPGEGASDERAKVYWAHLRELRDALLEKRKISLSELDVIVEEGEKAGWPK